MKLVSYHKEEQDQLAILADGLLYDTDLMHPDLPVSMAMFLNYWEDVYAITSSINKKIVEGKVSRQQGIDYDGVQILAPVPHATSCRNASAFRKNEQYPVFYFANHNCFQGPGEVVCMPNHLDKLDFSLEVAIVISKAGKNIKAADADEYIGGYMIMNSICSRHYETGKAVCDSGSANGKGFATPVGPMLVTTDELDEYKIDCKPDHTGSAYNLSMKCWVNDVQVCEGNLADMEWTFAEIIEQASYGVQLFPGDIIGSGTIRTGCFLELNAAGKINDPNYKEQWLKEGDTINMEVEGLGTLINTVVKEESDVNVDDLLPA